MRRLLDYNPLSGVRTYFHYDPTEHKDPAKRSWGFEYEFDSVKPELEASKALQNDDDHWKEGVKNDMVHYAHVPDSILLKWYAMGVDINNEKELFAMVNKPEWRYLKCVSKIHIAK